MTHQQCFGVIVRTFGLVVGLGGLYFLLTAVYVLAVPTTRPHSPPSTYVLYGIIIEIMGLYLLRGAPGLMRFCYPASPGEAQPRV